jgi:hypothetical protein
MTPALAISINAFLMLSLVTALAYVLSRASRLRPHSAAALAPNPQPPGRATRSASSGRARPGSQVLVAVGS